MEHKSITTLYLVRHGETDWNSSGRLQGDEDIELNKSGREQAVQLATCLKRLSWDLIISSPLKRAYETAAIIASTLSLPEIVVLETLKERNYGAASGLLPEERRKLFPDGVFPGQEDFENLRTRAMSAFVKITRDYPGQKIIVISHGAFINSILYTLSGGEFGSYKTRLKNGCISKITLEENTWAVGFFNQTVEELR